MMLNRKCFLPEIRRLGYRFKRRAKRVDIWRKANGTDYLSVPLGALLTKSYVCNVLRQNGLSQSQIDTFLSGLSSDCFG